jgi:hypothetical protein
MWFYSLIFQSTLYKHLYKFIIHKKRQQRPLSYFRRSSSFKRHHLFLLIYILINLSQTSAIHYNLLPISSLCGIPSLIILYQLYNTVNTSIYHPPFEIPSRISPSTNLSSFDLSTNSSKLAYLTAWQSVQNNNTTLMNFSPGSHPICVDTGATSCISNDKSHFTTLTP